MILVALLFHLFQLTILVSKIIYYKFKGYLTVIIVLSSVSVRGLFSCKKMSCKYIVIICMIILLPTFTAK